MFLTLLAAALVAATPQQQTTLDPAKDTPAVCAIRFDDNVNRIMSDGEANSPVIDMYAAKAGMTPEAKEAMSQYCFMFDMGALHVIEQMSKARSTPVAQ